MWDRFDQLIRVLDDRLDELTVLDSVAGDGDLGVTARQAVRAVAAQRPRLEVLPVDEQLTGIGRILATEAASTAGTLFAFGFLGAGRDQVAVPAAPLRLAQVLTALTETIAEKGGAAPGDKTMMDALIPAAAAARDAAAQGATTEAVLRAAARAAAEGAEATTAMTPKFGRPAWLADRSQGTVDAGARLVEVVLSGLAGTAAAEL